MSDEIKRLEDEVKSGLASVDKQVQDFIKETAESNSKLSAEQKAKMKELEEKSAEAEARMFELEQKLGKSGTDEEPKSFGDQFVNSDEFKNFVGGQTTKVSYEVKNTITNTVASTFSDRQSGIIASADRSLMIADVIPQGQTTSNSVEYHREASWVNNAAETAEAGQKPESDLTISVDTAPVRTIAHIIKLSRQVLEDSAQLVSYVNNRMTYGVNYRVDNQLLNGNGTGANLSGLLNTGNYTVFTPAGGVSQLDNIRKAMTIVQLAEYMPNAVIMSPSDVEALDLTKDSQGAYIAANPRAGIQATVWGLPIVTSNAMQAGQFLVGAFDMAAQIFNRSNVVFELFEQDGTNVQTNLVTARAERRLALAVYRPASIVGGSISGGGGS